MAKRESYSISVGADIVIAMHMVRRTIKRNSSGAIGSVGWDGILESVLIGLSRLWIVEPVNVAGRIVPNRAPFFLFPRFPVLLARSRISKRRTLQFPF